MIPQHDGTVLNHLNDGKTRKRNYVVVFPRGDLRVLLNLPLKTDLADNAS